MSKKKFKEKKVRKKKNFYKKNSKKKIKIIPTKIPDNFFFAEKNHLIKLWKKLPEKKSLNKIFY